MWAGLWWLLSVFVVAWTTWLQVDHCATLHMPRMLLCCSSLVFFIGVQEA